MKTITTTYQYRIKDSNEKLKKSLLKMSGVVNLVWNFCNDRQKEALTGNRYIKKLNGKNKSHFKWLSGYDLNNLTAGISSEVNIPAHTAQAVGEMYAKSRKQFKKPFLKYRTNKRNKNLPWIPFKGVSIKHLGNGIFTFHKLKLKTFYSRDLPSDGKITGGSIIMDSTGRWYINIVVKHTFADDKAYEQYQLNHCSSGQNLIAFDPGLDPMLSLSIEAPNGSVSYDQVDPQRYYRKAQDSLAMAQRANKKRRVKALHRKIKNKRKDYNWKLAHWLVMDNHTVVGTDFEISKLMKSKMKGHSKAYADVALGQFRQMLIYKAVKHNIKYVEVSERELKSTQTCSHCKSLTGPRGRKGLSISVWQCASCGFTHLRNQNSADNHRFAYKEGLFIDLTKL